jgi:hypothetical protein
MSEQSTEVENHVDGQYIRGDKLLDASPGTRIVGIPDVETLDDMVKTGERDTEWVIANRRVFSPSFKKNKPSNFIQRYLRKKNFYSHIDDIAVVRLPFDSSQFVYKNLRISEQESYSFLTELGLSIKDRGKIVTLVVASSVAVGSDGYHTYDLYKHKVLSGQAGARIFDALARSYETEWKAGQLYALSRIVSGGLPTLGKRR